MSGPIADRKQLIGIGRPDSDRRRHCHIAVLAILLVIAGFGLFEAWAGQESGPPGSPAIQLNHPSLVYFLDDEFVVRVAATTLFDGYLYVDHIDQQGIVTHIFPNERRPDNRAVAGQEIVVGGGDEGYPGDPLLMIDRPLGIDMILAISTAAPVFSVRRPIREHVSSYLPALHDGIASLSGRGFETPAITSFVLIEVRPRR